MHSVEEEKELNNTYNFILQKIIKLRIAAGYTQIDIADFVGLTESGYFKLEKGKTKLDTERLLLILYKLKISPKDFFKDIDINL
tara:strand:- start:4391 stop:4642 length:252 start_codon:yes stop_codon:yes gene_type:complete